MHSLDYLLVRLTDFLPTIWIEKERIAKGCKFASKGLKPLFYNLYRYVEVVGLGGLEPPTSPLSGVRSNQAELQTRLLRTGILAFYFNE